MTDSSIPAAAAPAITPAPALSVPPVATPLPASPVSPVDASTGHLLSAAGNHAPAAHDLTSTLIVDSTLWVLEAFSVVTWLLILIKGIQHLRIALSNRSYSKKFWGAADFQSASDIQDAKGPAARVAVAGFSTLVDTDSGTTTHDLEHTGDRQELLDRKLRQQMQKERGSLESGLAILATIGSISPFVGLFGTVWGIMGALTNISKSGSASLEIVAGPIGEALVATAVGIAVAVPAVIGYNFFIRRNKVIWAFLDDFAVDFVHLAQKTNFIIRSSVSVSGARSSAASLKKPSSKLGVEDFQAEGVQI